MILATDRVPAENHDSSFLFFIPLLSPFVFLPLSLIPITIHLHPSSDFPSFTLRHPITNMENDDESEIMQCHHCQEHLPAQGNDQLLLVPIGFFGDRFYEAFTRLFSASTADVGIMRPTSSLIRQSSRPTSTPALDPTSRPGSPRARQNCNTAWTTVISNRCRMSSSLCKQPARFNKSRCSMRSRFSTRHDGCLEERSEL